MLAWLSLKLWLGRNPIHLLSVVDVLDLVEQLLVTFFLVTALGVAFVFVGRGFVLLRWNL